MERNDKMERLIEIMFQEDEERYNNNQPLMYHTKEDFEIEKKEKTLDRLKSICYNKIIKREEKIK